MDTIMTVEETKEGLIDLAGKLENFSGLIKNTAYIVSGELEVSAETKKQISYKLQEFNEGFWGNDFRAVISAILKLTPNTVVGQFTREVQTAS